ncbi:MAG: hypothetical protein PHE29_13680 [Tissierellia bacterium]|nr:hypothetical protein [Tissierellia bacterium]
MSDKYDEYDEIAEKIIDEVRKTEGWESQATESVAAILRESFPAPVEGDEKALDFGAYVTIEQKRYGVLNEMYLHKVVGRFKSNFYVDVPVQSPATNILHDEATEVVACICCGVDEDEVKRYRVEDVRFTLFSRPIPSPQIGADAPGEEMNLPRYSPVPCYGTSAVAEMRPDPAFGQWIREIPVPDGQVHGMIRIWH